MVKRKLLNNSQRTTFPIESCIALYYFWDSLLRWLILWLLLSSLSPQGFPLADETPSTSTKIGQSLYAPRFGFKFHFEYLSIYLPIYTYLFVPFQDGRLYTNPHKIIKKKTILFKNLTIFSLVSSLRSNQNREQKMFLKCKRRNNRLWLVLLLMLNYSSPTSWLFLRNVYSAVVSSRNRISNVSTTHPERFQNVYMYYRFYSLFWFILRNIDFCQGMFPIQHYVLKADWQFFGNGYFTRHLIVDYYPCLELRLLSLK